MATFIVDTHAIWWDLTAPERLGRAARRVMDEAREGHHRLGVPAIVAAELLWIAAKHGFAERVVSLLTDVASGKTQYDGIDLRFSDVLKLHGETVPEMHDRMIVVVARANGWPVLTRDPEIVSAGVPTIWD